MPIYRDPVRITDGDKVGATSAPQDDNTKDGSKEFTTLDAEQIHSQYENDARSGPTDTFKTGAMIPSDMSVRLVRAESANWETFLSLMYSLCLTMAGIFAGSWASTKDFSTLEKFATIGFFSIAGILILVWVRVKVRLQKGGVNIPMNALQTFKDEDAERIRIDRESEASHDLIQLLNKPASLYIRRYIFLNKGKEMRL